MIGLWPKGGGTRNKRIDTFRYRDECKAKNKKNFGLCAFSRFVALKEVVPQTTIYKTIFTSFLQFPEYKQRIETPTKLQPTTCSRPAEMRELYPKVDRK